MILATCLLCFIVSLVFWSIVMATGEYVLHRWTMHRKRSWLPSWIFEHHSIEHHHHERNDINIDLPLHYHLIIGSPLLVIAYLVAGFPCLFALLAVFVFHSYTWTKLHRGIHDLENNWLMKTKYFERAKAHHLSHHDRPGKNFGVVYLFTDYIFGTKFK